MPRCYRMAAQCPVQNVAYPKALAVGTLIPVSGLIQVGGHLTADRYAYVPGIGLLILSVWGASDLLTFTIKGAVKRRGGLALAMGAVLSLCLVFTGLQIEVWRSDVSLWKHALLVPKRDCVMIRNNYGAALEQAGLPEAAVTEYQMGVNEELDLVAESNLAHVLMQLGRSKESLLHFKRASSLSGMECTQLEWLSEAYAKTGNRRKAMEYCLASLQKREHKETGEKLLRQLLLPSETQTNTHHHPTFLKRNIPNA